MDEEEVYRRSGLLDFTRPEHKAVAWRSAHGTHVLDLAAGEDRATTDEAAKARIASRPIIAVQLPVATTADTSGAGLEPHVLDGIEYILHRAFAAWSRERKEAAGRHQFQLRDQCRPA